MESERGVDGPEANRAIAERKRGEKIWEFMNDWCGACEK